MYKILIVEDEDIIRKGLMYSIDYFSLGCVIIAEANNGEDGIKLIKQYEPDIVIADINMPILNGLDMIKETYKEYNYSSIILSGYNEFEYAKKAMLYNVKQYLLKPVNHDELKEAIKSCIEQVEMKKLYNIALNNKKDILNKEFIKNLKNQSFYTTKIIEIIKEKYMDKLIMNDIVEYLNVSATLLNNKFKEDTGFTFNDYLNRYRIQIAINLLKENNYPIYKIAELTGFSDYKYFVKVFHKYTQVSPKEYKNIL